MTSGFQVPNAVQLRVSIDRIEPQIWRRLVVPLHFNLRELHLVLQAAFGWTNSHLHEFEIGGLRYGDELADAERAEDDPRTFEEMEVRLRDFTREPGTTFSYVYDMGDNWVHTVCLAKHMAIEPVPKAARCLEGGRARPPEDVGGPSGYQDFLEALLDPGHEEHRHMKRWAGGHFNPEWFDLDLTNKDVARALHMNLKRRARQPRPSRGT
jgi:Plasmid pRiA4b ORF-3-like protein